MFKPSVLSKHLLLVKTTEGFLDHLTITKQAQPDLSISQPTLSSAQCLSQLRQTRPFFFLRGHAASTHVQQGFGSHGRTSTICFHCVPGARAARASATSLSHAACTNAHKRLLLHLGDGTIRQHLYNDKQEVIQAVVSWREKDQTYVTGWKYATGWK